MKAGHDEAHDDVLKRVVCDELAPDSEAVRELAASCATCRGELRELGLVSSTLKDWGEQERGVLAEALGSVDAEDLGLVRRLAPARAGALPRRSGRMGLGILAAAAVLVVAFFVWRGRGSGEGERERHFLGDSDPRCLRPVEQVESYDEFAWDWDRLEEESFTLVIWNAGEASPVVRIPRLESSAWIPAPEQQAALGEEIRWEVRRLGAGGELVDSIQAFAWRSR